MAKIHETTPDEIIGQALVNGVPFDELLAHDGPGRFEGNANRPLAVAIDALINDGGADESGGDVDSSTGYFARVDRWITYYDDRGFVSVVEYYTEDYAQRAFAELEREYDAWFTEAGES